jgi:ABC-type nitrate/sulfonate/bicarbonate transport system ATPase subunit
MLMRLQNVTLFHHDGGKLLHTTELTLSRGDNYLVDGAHGAGKSTFLKLVAGAVEPSRGAVERAHGTTVGMMFTEGGLVSNLTLVDNLVLPLRFSLGVEREAARERARAALAAAGLGRFMELRPHALNARVRRLAQVARLEAVKPDVILLDEPLEGFGGSDREYVRARVQAWCGEGSHCLLVSSMRGGELGIDLERLSLMDGSIRPSSVPG